MANYPLNYTLYSKIYFKGVMNWLDFYFVLLAEVNF